MSDEFLPRAALEQWTVPEMPGDMKERVMRELQEPWSVSVGPGPSVAANRSHVAMFTAVAALAASAAAVVIAIALQERDAEPPARGEPVQAIVAEPRPEPASASESASVSASASESASVSASESASAPPRRVPKKTFVVGALTREQIRKVVRAHIGDVRDCYAQGLTRDPSLTGSVSLRLVIAASGHVAESTVHASTLSDPVVGTCIADAARRWVFPAHGGANTVVVYPFALEPG